MFWVSEGKIGWNGFKLLCFGFGSSLMDGIAVNENRPVRPGGACMFAGTAADAYFVLHLRDKQPALVGNHMACLGGAVFGTCPACGLFGMNYAIILNKYSFANLGQFLGIKHERHYGPGGAYIRTTGTFIIAESAVEIHPGLHDTGKSVFTDRWLENICRAGVDAQGAGSATACKCGYPG